MNTTAPHPGPHPGPELRVPDPDELRVRFEDLVGDSASASAAGEDAPVTDHQVDSLDAAHELLAQALAALDSTR